MIIGILTVNGFDFHPNKRFLESATSLGHEILLINPYELVCSMDQGKFDFSMGSAQKIPDVILPRQGSPMGEYGFVLLRHFVQMGIPLVNGVEGVTLAKNQYLTLQALGKTGIAVPNSCFITRKTSFLKAVDLLGGFPVIVKQVDGMGGDGVAKMDTWDRAEKFLDQHLNPLKGMVVQQFIPPEGRKDVRMLVINGRMAAAMVLEPPAGDFRANIHQNSRARALDPPEEWKKLALKASRACCLEIAGVDMIVEKTGRPLVVEVNFSPGFKGLEAATQIDISQQIIVHALSVALDKKKRAVNPIEIRKRAHENT